MWWATQNPATYCSAEVQQRHTHSTGQEYKTKQNILPPCPAASGQPPEQHASLRLLYGILSKAWSQTKLLIGR